MQNKTINTTPDVFQLNREEFIRELASRTTPQVVYEYASSIYGVLTVAFKQDCMDSVLREWAFQWATEELGIDYDSIYNRWLS